MKFMTSMGHFMRNVIRIDPEHKSELTPWQPARMAASQSRNESS